MSNFTEQQFAETMKKAYELSDARAPHFSVEKSDAIHSMIAAYDRAHPSREGLAAPRRSAVLNLGFDWKLGFGNWKLPRLELAPQYAMAGVLLVLGISAGGVVQAAAGSLPGDRLYPLKVQIEQAMVESQRNPKDRLAARISFASHRLNDLDKVKARNSVDHFRVEQATNLYMRELTRVYEEVAALEGSKNSSREIVAAATAVNIGTSELSAQLQRSIGAGKTNGLGAALATTKAINRQSLQTLVNQPESKGNPEIQVRVQVQMDDATKRLGEVQGKVWAAGLGRVTTRPDILKRASDDVKILVGRPDLAEQYLAAAASAVAVDPKMALEKVQSAEFLTSKTEEELAGGAGEKLSQLAAQVPGVTPPPVQVKTNVLFSPERK